jgi:tetratricopeptide (TPR) repeat protein
MSNVKEDTIKLHKDANALMESGKYAEARDLFVKVGELYYKGQNYFGAAEMNYKAGECSVSLKDYAKGAELFSKSADISLAKAFERYGLSALESARDCQKELGNKEKVEEINKKISEINQKLKANETEDSSFSVFS